MGLEGSAIMRSNVDIDARYELAGTLLRNGELDEATEEFVWLWRGYGFVGNDRRGISARRVFRHEVQGRQGEVNRDEKALHRGCHRQLVRPLQNDGQDHVDR